MANGSVVDRTLYRAILVAVIVVLALGGVLLWQMARVASSTEQAIVAAKAEVQQLAERVRRLEEKGAKALGVDDLEATLDRMGELREGFDEPGSLDAAAQQEIKALITTVRTSGLAFESAGNRDSSVGFAVRCWTKYRAYARSLRSAEDFIDKLAAKSLSGDDYAVVHPDGTRQPLREWLTRKLADGRAARLAATAPSADASPAP